MSISDFDLLAQLPRAPEKRSTSELLARLGAAGHQMTPRSLQRRLGALSGAYPILCDDRSKPYGWSIAADAPPTLGAMSVQEAVALKLSERYLRQVFPADIVDDLKHYFAQADKKLKGESLYRAWLGKVRLEPTNQPLISPTLSRQVVTNAYAGVLRGEVLQVSYLSRDTAEAKSYEIEPRAIIVRGPVTYLVAQFLWSGEVTLMALHRFKSAKLAGRKIRSRPDFDIDHFIRDGGMGFLPTGIQTLHLRFYYGAATHLVDTPISLDQQLTGDPSDVSDLIVQLPITEQLKWWILGFGESVEVLAPVELRQEIHRRVIGAVARYAVKASA